MAPERLSSGPLDVTSSLQVGLSSHPPTHPPTHFIHPLTHPPTHLPLPLKDEDTPEQHRVWEEANVIHSTTHPPYSFIHPPTHLPLPLQDEDTPEQHRVWEEANVMATRNRGEEEEGGGHKQANDEVGPSTHPPKTPNSQ